MRRVRGGAVGYKTWPYTGRVTDWNEIWGKTEWRRWAKETRAQLDVPTLSQEVVRQLEGWPRYQNARHILSYLAFGSELDLSGLLAHTDKHFYTTRTGQDGTLTVHRLTANLERHRYGFWQPTADSPVVGLERLELLLVPGLAFDVSGARLGHGKGFYDRLLAQVKDVPVVGVTLSELIVPVLPAEQHDVRMTHLLSEKGMLELPVT